MTRRAVVGIAPVLLLAACAAPTPMTTMAPKSDFAEAIRILFFEIVGLDGLILTVVLVALALGIFRHSTRTGLGTELSRATQFKLETTWTIGPALIILAIAIPSVRLTFRTQAAPIPPGALAVRVIARQWWWEASYPALGVTTANEIHLPLRRPVRILLESADIIHSFWVPQLGGKRDVVPGQTNEIVLVPRVAGTYPGQCAEFCGTSHANMRFRVVVEAPEDFAAWVTHEKSPAAVPVDATAAAGARLFAQSTCTPCHTVGEVAAGRFGPDLTHFASRATFAGGTLANTPANVAAWLADPQALKPGAKMPRLGLGRAELGQLVAYLESLR